MARPLEAITGQNDDRLPPLSYHKDFAVNSIMLAMHYRPSTSTPSLSFAPRQFLASSITKFHRFVPNSLAKSPHRPLKAKKSKTGARRASASNPQQSDPSAQPQCIG